MPDYNACDARVAEARRRADYDGPAVCLDCPYLYKPACGFDPTDCADEERQFESTRYADPVLDAYLQAWIECEESECRSGEIGNNDYHG